MLHFIIFIIKFVQNLKYFEYAIACGFSPDRATIAKNSFNGDSGFGGL
jgi:hypothetical protein